MPLPFTRSAGVPYDVIPGGHDGTLRRTISALCRIEVAMRLQSGTAIGVPVGASEPSRVPELQQRRVILLCMTSLAQIRKLCLSLPETSERLSHGAPTFFIRGKRTFVMYVDNHHDDGRRAIWCAAPEGMQQALTSGEPENYFVPPYVGPRGWLGVRLDRGLGWEQVAGAVEDAYLTVAPKTLVAAVSRSGGSSSAGPPASTGRR
jgi:hypothetical protein